jgi:hypothetical protein
MEPAEADVLHATLRVACTDRDYGLMFACLAAAGTVGDGAGMTATRVAVAQVAACASSPATPAVLGAMSEHLRTIFSAAPSVFDASFIARGVVKALQLDATVRVPPQRRSG